MDTIDTKIRNSELLTSIFDHWPSFHDAEVISINLERAGRDQSGPALVASVYLFEMTKDVDDHGYCVLKNHTMIKFAFHEIDDSSIAGFNHQNVLWELSVRDISSSQLERLKFEVHFSSSFGVEAKFKCRAIEVLSADRTDPLQVDGFPRQLPPKAGAHNPN